MIAAPARIGFSLSPSIHQAVRGIVRADSELSATVHIARFEGASLHLDHSARSMDEREPRQRVTDAMITKMIQALDLKRVESLPTPGAQSE